MSLKTTTLSKFPEINLDIMLDAMRQIEEKYGKAKVLNCSPEAYIAIKDFFDAYEMEQWIKSGAKEYNPVKAPDDWGSLYGLEIKLDPTLKPGEWEYAPPKGWEPIVKYKYPVTETCQ